MALHLEKQKRRFPEDFEISFKEQVSYDSIIKFLTREKELSSVVRQEVSAQNELQMSMHSRKLFEDKPYFDIQEYEQTIVNQALQKPAFG